MDMKISTIKDDKRRPGISCNLYEARDTPTLVNPADTVRLQQNLEAEDHLIPWALSITPDDEKTPYVTTHYGPAPIRTLLSHQFTVTEWSCKVFSNFCTVQRTSNQRHMAYPDFPLTKRVDTYSKPSIYPLTETQEQIVKKITISHEDTVNIEKTTRQQATDKRLHDLQLLRLTASSFGRIKKRVRAFENLAKEFLDQKKGKKKISETLKHKFKYGKRLEPVALERYKEYMHKSGYKVRTEQLA